MWLKVLTEYFDREKLRREPINKTKSKPTKIIPEVEGQLSLF